jgi:hypothetical protein
MAETSSGFENNKGELKKNNENLRCRLKIINGQKLTRLNIPNILVIS